MGRRPGIRRGVLHGHDAGRSRRHRRPHAVATARLTPTRRGEHPRRPDRSRRDALRSCSPFRHRGVPGRPRVIITAVALPAIVADLADWTRLREASWVVNGYLLAYARHDAPCGRLADRCGSRRLFQAVASCLRGRQPAGGTVAESRGARFREGHPGGRRRRAGASGDGGGPHLFEGAPDRGRLGRSERSRSSGWRPGRSWGRRSSARSIPTQPWNASAWRGQAVYESPCRPGAGSFYVTADALVALLTGWAAAWLGMERRRAGVDLVGAALFTAALGGRTGRADPTRHERRDAASTRPR